MANMNKDGKETSKGPRKQPVYSGALVEVLKWKGSAKFDEISGMVEVYCGH